MNEKRREKRKCDKKFSGYYFLNPVLHYVGANTVTKTLTQSEELCFADPLLGLNV